MQIYKPSLARPLRNTTFAVCALVSVILAGCAASDAEIRRARNSGYQADFATVYSEALAAVTELYPHTVENAVTGLVQTAWHVVAIQSGSGRDSNPRTSALASPQATSGGVGNLSGTASSDRKRFFIRFRVHVIGGQPWRVRVQGEASEWSAGDVPMPLRGAEVPPWLKGRSDALQVAIYRRLKKYAIKVEKDIPLAESRTVSIDQASSFGDIPEGAQELLAALHRALSLRDMADLRGLLAEDVQWSVGDAGNADVAMAMWQADTTLLDAMHRSIKAGCAAGDGALSVSCPASYASEANYTGHRVIVEQRDGAWLVTAFVDGK